MALFMDTHNIEGGVSAVDVAAAHEADLADLIETRARALVAAAVDIDAPWSRHLGTPPTEPQARDLWTQMAATVAAYRDRYQIDRDVPLGGGATNDAGRADRRRAQRALRDAALLARTTQPAPRRETPAVLAVSANGPSSKLVVQEFGFRAATMHDVRGTW
nr:hypothetical protein [uncultured Nocardioides sp.]